MNRNPLPEEKLRDQSNINNQHTVKTVENIMTTQLKSKRIALKLRQLDVAFRAGWHPSRVCLYELGMRPTQQAALKLAQALNCDVREIYPDFDDLRSTAERPVG
jgi:transcriptional regulator with XRE-family HTH domain